MSYIFWLILPTAIWCMAWIVIDFIVKDSSTHELEDIVNCKWSKNNE